MSSTFLAFIPSVLPAGGSLRFVGPAAKEASMPRVAEDLWREVTIGRKFEGLEEEQRAVEARRFSAMERILYAVCKLENT